MSARVSGYVVRVNVDDNQWVEKGTVLVEISEALALAGQLAILQWRLHT